MVSSEDMRRLGSYVSCLCLAASKGLVSGLFQPHVPSKGQARVYDDFNLRVRYQWMMRIISVYTRWSKNTKAYPSPG